MPLSLFETAQTPQCSVALRLQNDMGGDVCWSRVRKAAASETFQSDEKRDRGLDAQQLMGAKNVQLGKKGCLAPKIVPPLEPSILCS